MSITAHRVSHLSVFLMLLFLLPGCKSLELKSHWQDREVVIDGRNTEWQNVLTVLEGKQASIGLINDREYLYIGLMTTDQGVQRQVLRQGLTIWFDRNGGEDKTLGIRYPLGGPGFSAGGSEGTDEATSILQNPGGELEIYGPGEKDHQRMSRAQTAGIDVAYTAYNNLLIYEIKVPLADMGRHPFAIDTKAGDIIGIGLEAAGIRGSERPPESARSGGEGRGGYGGRSGKSGGRSRGESGGTSGSRGQVEPFKIWAKVRLAMQDSTRNQ